MPRKQALTDVQLAVMRVLWDQGHATVADITDALRAERGLALTTVATLLTRLEKRALVRRDTSGRVHVYWPRITENEVRRSMVSELTERLFDGDAAALVSHLIAERELDEADLGRVRALLEGRAKRRGTDETR